MAEHRAWSWASTLQTLSPFILFFPELEDYGIISIIKKYKYVVFYLSFYWKKLNIIIYLLCLQSLWCPKWADNIGTINCFLYFVLKDPQNTFKYDAGLEFTSVWKQYVTYNVSWAFLHKNFFPDHPSTAFRLFWTPKSDSTGIRNAWNIGMKSSEVNLIKLSYGKRRNMDILVTWVVFNSVFLVLGYISDRQQLENPLPNENFFLQNAGWSIASSSKANTVVEKHPRDFFLFSTPKEGINWNF